jgi:hypothetical protein
MASFEVVVRPVVFPNIRPQGTPRSLPPEDDPEKGFCVIRGNPGKSFDLSYSYSFNATSGNETEIERDVDEVRVYQEEDDGTINHDNFVDIKVPKKIEKEGAAKDDWTPNKRLEANRKMRWVERYRPVQQQDNVEILQRDENIKNEGAE